MTPLRYRDEEPVSRSLAYVFGGALAGFAVGALVAHRFGGVGGVAERLREHFGAEPGGEELQAENDYAEDEYDDDLEELGIGAESMRAPETVTPELEEIEQRVLEGFRNDPILAARPVDISAISDGIVELTGWVNAEDEASHAVTLARGIPGVDTVVNRLAIRPREQRFDEYADRYASGDPALAEGHWEGQSIGTGRRRQGNSSEPDRHADPRQNLAERWTNEDAAIAEAADEVGESGRREPPKRQAKRRGRADGSPVAPTGIPKADHVAEPEVNPPPNPPRAD